MDTEIIEKELREYLLAEVKEVEPSHGWWDNAVSRLGEPKRRSRWFGIMPKTRLAWVLLPVILLLIGGTVYGASSIIRELFQKYATDVEEAGLAQELDLSQTIDGVTVKLERAYADSNVILVGYTVSGPNSTYHPDFGEIYTTDGQSIPGMMGIGTVPGSDMILGSWAQSERAAMIASFDASALEGSPSELSLRLETSVGDWAIPGEDQASVGHFKFDFNVPFHAGKIIDVGQTVEAAGVPITLEQVVVSPWATRSVFSFSAPYDSKNRPWPIVSLMLPSGETENSSFGGTSGDYFNRDFTGQSGEWTITIKELVFPPEPGSQTAGTHPASDTKRLAGPWVFHFQVP